MPNYKAKMPRLCELTSLGARRMARGCTEGLLPSPYPNESLLPYPTSSASQLGPQLGVTGKESFTPGH